MLFISASVAYFSAYDLLSAAAIFSAVLLLSAIF